MPLPSGEVTFLFTDIEGSTRLLHELGDRYAEALTKHRDLLRRAFLAHDGHEVNTQGDAFFVAFGRSFDAIAAASDAQRALAAASWPGGTSLRVRMGIHTGRPALVGDDYVGMDVHKGARICSAGHGGQVLLSRSALQAAGGLPEGVTILDLGEHVLKDLAIPEPLNQLVIEGLPSTFPTLRSQNPTNLPAATTRLIGRDQDLDEVGRLLADDNVRLVTLIGPGGSGKTRLAIEVGRQSLARFPAGVFFAPLGSINDPELVLPSVAQILGVGDRDATRPLEGLKQQIRDRTLLLVLDNFEHLLAAAPDVSTLLEACPKLRVLATSRAPLNIRGEHRHAVGPLEVIAPDSAAVELFVERASAADPGLIFDKGLRHTAEGICLRLDGLPLAIELAAARVALLSPDEILQRLERGTGVLAQGPRDAPDRHRSLRAAIDWSVDLLDVNERDVFAKLGVFIGGFTLETAERLCGPEVLDLLPELTDASLVWRRRSPDGRTRFGMLETIREAAVDRLGERLPDIQRAHGDLFVTLAEAAEADILGSEQQKILSLLDDELGNLRAAMRWSLDRDDVTVAARIASSLTFYWWMRNLSGEGQRWFGLVRDKATDLPDALRARAAFGHGWAATFQREHDEAKVALREAVELYSAAGNVQGHGRSLGVLASVCWETGEPYEEHLQAGLALARDCGDDWMETYCVTEFGRAASRRGETEAAIGHYEEVLAIMRRVGELSALSITLLNLGGALMLDGQTQRAKSLLQESIGICRALGFAYGGAAALVTYGELVLLEGRPDEAATYFRDALITGGQERQNLDATALAFLGLAGCAVTDGRFERAAMLVGATEATRDSAQIPRPAEDAPIDAKLLSVARATLGEERWSQGVEAGRRLTLEEAIALALSDD